MKAIIVLTFCSITFLFTSSIATKPCLCEKSEENLYSFRLEKSQKIMSVCIGKDNSYMQYRFGLPGKIELAYPDKKDENSWDKFTYEGYTRGGGPANAGMNTQTLSFENKGTSYSVYYINGYADDRDESFFESAGITVQANAKFVNLEAELSSRSGSLEMLNWDGKELKIKNRMWE